MILVRILLGALVALLLVVVVLPAVVLIDLLVGGTGLGLCANGLGACETSVFTILEMAGLLLGAATVLGFAVAGCLRVLHRQSRPKAMTR